MGNFVNCKYVTLYQSQHAINQNGLYLYTEISKVYTKNGKTNASPTPKNKTKYKIIYTDKQTDKNR